MNFYIKKAATSCFEPITIEALDKREGLYSITTPAYSAYCIQMIEPNDSLEQRILYMAERPVPNADKYPNTSFSLPLAAVYDENKRLFGYMQPKAFPRSISLTTLTTYQRKPLAQMKRYADKTEWHDKFERDEKGIKNRLKLLYNIAKALHALPAQYVPAHISPEDILITATGKVTLANLIWSEVSQGEKLLFAACNVNQDYLSVEGKRCLASKSPMTQSAAIFAYAVIFYQVLTGTHPYSGTILSEPYSQCVEIGQCIDNNLFAFGEKSEYISFPENFNLHSTFSTLDPKIQSLFKRAFSSEVSSHPTLDEWGKTLYESIAAMN